MNADELVQRWKNQASVMGQGEEERKKNEKKNEEKKKKEKEKKKKAAKEKESKRKQGNRWQMLEEEMEEDEDRRSGKIILSRGKRPVHRPERLDW